MKIKTLTEQEQSLVDELCERVGGLIANPATDPEAAERTIRDFAARVNFDLYSALERSEQQNVRDYAAVLVRDAAMEAYQASQAIAEFMGPVLTDMSRAIQAAKREVLAGTGPEASLISASPNAKTPDINWLNSFVDCMSTISYNCMFSVWAELPDGFVPMELNDQIDYNTLIAAPGKLGILFVHAGIAETLSRLYAKINENEPADTAREIETLWTRVSAVCSFSPDGNSGPKTIDLPRKFPLLPPDNRKGPRLAPDGKQYN